MAIPAVVTGDKSALIERLRQQIEKVEAAPRRYLVTLSTGVPEVDRLGVFQLGGAVELSGEEASGRTSLALATVASACREKRLAAWVDGPAELYPPAAQALGVELSRLLIVRPKAPKQLVWSAVQLLRSGAFTCVVLDVTHTGVRLTLADTKKLVEAARAGGALLVLLTSESAPAQGVVRLSLRTQVLEVATSEPVSHLRLVPRATPPRARGGAVRANATDAPEAAREGTANDVTPRVGAADDATRAARPSATTRPSAMESLPEPDFELSVTHSARGGHGQRVTVPRHRQRARLRQASGAPEAGLTVPRVRAAASLQRPKKNELRDGVGLAGSHPRTTSPDGGLRVHVRSFH